MNLVFFFKLNRLGPVGLCCLFLFIVACTSMAPVQEMSNARQTLRAAEEVEARRYAPELWLKAESLLQAAETQLAEGDYEQARTYALAARQEASRARQKALEEKKSGF